MTNLAIGVGGLAMAGANGGALIATLGVTGAASAASMALGSAMVGAVAARLLDGASGKGAAEG